MKKFLKHIALSLLALVVINALIHYAISPDRDGNLSALLLKKELFQQSEGSRLILVGGSSVAYGYNSKQLEEDLGMKVVNAGLHAGLGLDFYSGFIRDYVKKGDVVVLIPEYNALFAEPRADRIFYLAAELDRKVLSYKDEGRGTVNSGKAFFLINKLKIRRTLLSIMGVENSELTRGSVDKYGDVMNNIGEKAKPKLNALANMPETIPEEVISIINDLSKELKAKGAKLMMSYPPLAASEYSDDQKVTRLSSELQKQLDIRILNRPLEQKFGDELFFDTFYHLNTQGREQNTGRFLESFTMVGNQIKDD